MDGDDGPELPYGCEPDDGDGAEGIIGGAGTGGAGAGGMAGAGMPPEGAVSTLDDILKPNVDAA